MNGCAEACADTPLYVTVSVRRPSHTWSAQSYPYPCNMMAASSESNAPSRAMYSLPVCPSSAGVPSKTTFPGNCAFACARASTKNAPTPVAQMTLCPHACPISGNASYSARMPMVRPVDSPATTSAPASSPTWASTEVSTPYTPVCASIPCARNSSTIARTLSRSSNAVSANW